MCPNKSEHKQRAEHMNIYKQGEWDAGKMRKDAQGVLRQAERKLLWKAKAQVKRKLPNEEEIFDVIKHDLYR